MTELADLVPGDVWGVVEVAVAWSLRVGLDAGLLFWLSGIELRHLKALAPSGALVAAMAALLFMPGHTGRWRWVLAAAVLLASAAWSWRSSEFLVGTFPRIRLPARAGL